MARKCRAGRWVPRGRQFGRYAWQRGPCGTSSLESERARMARRPVVLRHPPARFGQVARLLLREEAGERPGRNPQRRTNSSTCMERCPLRTYQRRFLSTSIRRASSATLMPRSYRARSILATMRSAWFIRLLALSSLPASGAGARTLGGSRIVANRTNSPATYGEKGLL